MNYRSGRNTVKGNFTLRNSIGVQAQIEDLPFEDLPLKCCILGGNPKSLFQEGYGGSGINSLTNRILKTPLTKSEDDSIPGLRITN